MKKLTRKLFISVLVAVFAFVALGTSTYAWITLSNNAEVNAFEAQIEAGEAGIELSEDYAGDVEAAKWTTSLTLTGPFTTKLNDVTMEYDADGNMKFYDFKSVYDEDEGKNSMEIDKVDNLPQAEVDYIEFSIWMKRTNSTDALATTTVKVNGAKVAFALPEGASAEGEFTYKNGDTTVSQSNLYAYNAARLSITAVVDGEEEKDNTVIYEQKAGTDPETENTAGYSATGFAHKYAESQDITIEGTGPAYSNVLQAGNDSEGFIVLTGNDPVELKVRVWIEGWDNECHAQILTQKLSVAFGFEIVG